MRLAEAVDPVWVELEGWARQRGRAQAARLIASKRLDWLDADELAWHTAGAVWERAQRGPLGSPVGYAVRLLPRAALDLAYGRREAHRWVPLEDTPAHDRAPASVDADRAAPAGSAHVVTEETRRRITDWLPSARPVGHGDAAFGDPVLHAAVLLSLAEFAERPLSPQRWPAGFEEIDGLDLPTSQVHLRAALWLADRSYFPPSPTPEVAEATLRKRRRDAGSRLRRRAEELGLEAL